MNGILFQDKEEIPLFINISPPAHSASFPMSTGGHFPGGLKYPGFADGHSPPSTTADKNVLSYAATSAHDEVFN
jgi:hypothetical protein